MFLPQIILGFLFHFLSDEVLINLSFLRFSAEGNTASIFSETCNCSISQYWIPIQLYKHYVSLSLMSHKEKNVWPNNKWIHSRLSSHLWVSATQHTSISFFPGYLEMLWEKLSNTQMVYYGSIHTRYQDRTVSYSHILPHLRITDFIWGISIINLYKVNKYIQCCFKRQDSINQSHVIMHT